MIKQDDIFSQVRILRIYKCNLCKDVIELNEDELLNHLQAIHKIENINFKN